MLLVTVKNLIKLLASYFVGKSFLNYRLYKRYFSDQPFDGALKLLSTERIAIVMQGPLIIDSNFTIETLKLYRRNFPDSILILSTWSVSSEMTKEILENDVHIVQNKMPENTGIANLNLQIITTSAGVVAARDLGAKFILKTRTDQRIYHPSLETYLFNTLKYYPFNPKSCLQTKRLVCISLGTFKFRLYGVSDMFLFGHVDDMLRYWNIPLIEPKDFPKEQYSVCYNTWRTFSNRSIPEVYLCTEFLKNIGREVHYSLADSFQVFRDHFVVIDQAAIKLYWHKYTLNADRYNVLGLFDPELSFNDWLLLYNSIDSLIIDETILDRNIN